LTTSILLLDNKIDSLFFILFVFQLNMKYYAVNRGRRTGIFLDWPSCQDQVSGYKGAIYKSFNTKEEAELFVLTGKSSPKRETLPSNSPVRSSYQNSPVRSPYRNSPIRSSYQNSPIRSFYQNSPVRSPYCNSPNESSYHIISTTSCSTDLVDVETTIDPSINYRSLTNNEVIIYTDGSCMEKRGGYAYLIIDGKQITKHNGRVPYNPCTNQIAELYAIRQCLAETTYQSILIMSDSSYSIKCLTEWHITWRMNGWVNSKKEPVANQDLIKEILELMKDRNIKFQHVYAHQGNIWNEQVDILAKQGTTYDLPTHG